MVMEPVAYRQFSVIGRLRRGVPCTLSNYEIIMQITNQLNQYHGIFTVGFSSPNFMFHFTTVELQLEVLSRRTFTGEGFILDVFPWSPEHQTLNLPWIIARYRQERPRANTKRLLNNLAAQPEVLHRHVSLLTTEPTPRSINLGPLPEAAIIHMENSSSPQNPRTMADFSYLMILELKDFYYDKFAQYKNCKDICSDIYGITIRMHDEMDTKIDSVCDKARQYESLLSDEVAYQVNTMCGSLYNQMLYVGEELFSLGFMMDPTEQASNYPINLSNYKPNRSATQAHTPLASVRLLKNILHTTVHHISAATPTITTSVDTRGFFTTEISYAQFRHKYISKTSTTIDEAEASGIYRFLKYMVNVLGYNIVDANYGTLSRLIYQLNYYNAQMSAFYQYIHRATTMIDEVHNNMKTMNEHLNDEIPKRIKLKLHRLLADLEKLTGKFHTAAHHLLDLFDHHKRIYTFTRLDTIYRSKPDSIYSS